MVRIIGGVLAIVPRYVIISKEPFDTAFMYIASLSFFENSHEQHLEIQSTDLF